MHLGITDLAGQLRRLDQFSEIELAPFWLVAGLIFVYLLLIGPLDFFLHRNVTRRMALSWVSFPLWVVLFSAGAYWGAGRLKGDKLRINQVDLVDIDAASRNVRGTTWLNLFSPETTEYDLSLEPQIAGQEAGGKRDLLWSWMGLPGPARWAAWNMPRRGRAACLSRIAFRRNSTPRSACRYPSGRRKALRDAGAVRRPRRGSATHGRRGQRGRRTAHQPVVRYFDRQRSGLRPLGLFAGRYRAGPARC